MVRLLCRAEEAGKVPAGPRVMHHRPSLVARTPLGVVGSHNTTASQS